MRIELRDGQWAELRERISHGQDKEIKRARVLVQQHPTENLADDLTTALRVYIKAWNMRDLDDASIALDDADAIERLPADIANLLLGHIVELYAGKPEPAVAPQKIRAV